MLRVKGKEIHLTKGDTAYLTVGVTRLVNGNIEDFPLTDGSELMLTIVKNIEEEAVVKKTIVGSNVFIFYPSDTEKLGVGRYVYTIKLKTEDEEIFTVVNPSDFYIEKNTNESFEVTENG